MAVEPLIHELGKTGRRAVRFPAPDVPETPIPDHLLRQSLHWPEVSEIDVVRHFTRVSQKNHAIDINMYPLGSCTMKYNPKINEAVARYPGFARLHPYQPESTVQGALELMHELQGMLAEISGFDAVTLQPAAGAHGELTGCLIIGAYHKDRGDTRRTKMLIPDSAHGTNPATARMAGFEVVEVPSDDRGNADLEKLRALVGPDVAGLMITNPNTLGLWDEHIHEIVEVVHEAGGLVYNDGANFNAILGIARPGDLGIDVMHYNLHKTFSTPHGGGGPGSGPVGVTSELERFLPGPRVRIAEDTVGDSPRYEWFQPEASIGQLHSFHGNFGMHVRAYCYIRMHGAEGLRMISEDAVLNANYLMSQLRDHFEVAYDRTCMHEFVLSGSRQKRNGVRTLDMAKRLLDFGVHPPTTYFPLIVAEALMIEPTETESKESLDYFIDALIQIAGEAEREPEKVTGAPHTTEFKRLDEVGANRALEVRWVPPMVEVEERELAAVAD
ncbi:MAG: Glycine dehydrogenase [decarboxylating] (glycine cleavage system P2 protein) [uncultured Thermomicrobiales bacterium]|uniref:Probable glycine dehydrogenase (decarboxylating) subunit 2 n=1 Tax=uncultured Thermomicrobiales bacterium TaxID=1645740 RepID=A0A6J4VMB0_9BACT|nr:MAG: Glycine dehydrogenase [decarboxylating] (glycine cleavage system P2 protein) [uncultured Thermomicrobiales bacterium]